MALVTLSRETCSLGDELAAQLAERLGCAVINREYVITEWLRPENSYERQQLQDSAKFYLHEYDEGATYADRIADMLRQRAAAGSLLVQGLGGQLIFREDPNAIHLRVVSSFEKRRERACEAFGLGRAEAERFLRLSDRKHRRYIWEVFGKDWTAPELYHLILNLDGLTLEQACDLAAHLLDLQKQAGRPLGHTEVGQDVGPQPDTFAHPSEAEFAQLLDRYQLRYQYEPTTFPMEWDADGNVTMAFSPDFYLPEFDTYIELTTMKQQYASIKNRKIRRLKELYPDINIRMVFRRDFRVLVERFGLARGRQTT